MEEGREASRKGQACGRRASLEFGDTPLRRARSHSSHNSSLRTMSLRTAFSPIFRTSTRGTGRAFSTSPVAAKHYLEATPAQFETVITQDRVVLVDFFATWCGPCKVLTPILKSTINEDGSADRKSQSGRLRAPPHAPKPLALAPQTSQTNPLYPLQLSLLIREQPSPYRTNAGRIAC